MGRCRMDVDRLTATDVHVAVDFPALTPDRWLTDFAKLELKEEVRPLILEENAVRLLGLCENSEQD